MLVESTGSPTMSTLATSESALALAPRVRARPRPRPLPPREDFDLEFAAVTGMFEGVIGDLIEPAERGGSCGEDEWELAKTVTLEGNGADTSIRRFS